MQLTSKRGHVYFHAPCFDGVASAAIAASYLRHAERWEQIDFHPVNYHLKSEWLSSPLPANSCVVDFAYHPEAVLWADHHSTTFLHPSARAHYLEHRIDRFRIYDPKAGSCALLLTNRLDQPTAESRRLQRIAEWANRIDSAEYESVGQALFSDEPAIAIANSLADRPSDDYALLLVRSLIASTLDETASLPQVVQRRAHVEARVKAGIDLLRQCGTTIQGVFTFEVDAGDSFIHRYAPYAVAPQAGYSVGLIHSASGHRITAMRNPWMNFESIHIGDLCQRFGGGGHERVGGIVFSSSETGAALAAYRAIVSAVISQPAMAPPLAETAS